MVRFAEGLAADADVRLSADDFFTLNKRRWEGEKPQPEKAWTGVGVESGSDSGGKLLILPAILFLAQGFGIHWNQIPTLNLEKHEKEKDRE